MNTPAFHKMTSDQIDEWFNQEGATTQERLRCLNEYIGAADNIDSPEAFGVVTQNTLYAITKDIVISGVWRYTKCD